MIITHWYVYNDIQVYTYQPSATLARRRWDTVCIGLETLDAFESIICCLRNGSGHRYLGTLDRSDAGLMLAQRLRRWASIKPALDQRLVFSGVSERVNFAIRRFLHNHGNSATNGSPTPGLDYALLLTNDYKRSL